MEQAEYNSVLQIDQIEIKPYDISAKIRFLSSDGTLSEPVYFSATRSQDTSIVPQEVADNFLDIIHMSDGLRELFFDFKEYRVQKLSEQVVNAAIVSLSLNRLVSVGDVYDEIRRTMPDISVSKTQIETQMYELVHTGILLEEQTGVFMVDSTDYAAIAVCHILTDSGFL